MKNILFSAVIALLFVSCANYSKQITVTNTLDFARKGEIVEVQTADLQANFAGKSYILKNDKGEEIGYQLSEDGSVLIFQADVAANSSAVYTLTEGKPAEVAPKTDAFFVPERKDDFAFENDFAAYRMYGPALKPEYPSNGVDLWLKSTDKPVMRRFYDGELKEGKSYHINRGEGLDCYKVGHTLGAGGVAPYIDGKLYVGDQYSSYEILEKGALCSVFTLTYDSFKVGDDVYKEEITVIVKAGSPLIKAIVKFTGKEHPIKLATGIFLHKDVAGGILNSHLADGILEYAENAFTDSGLPAAEANKPVGRNYVCVVVPSENITEGSDDAHAFLLSDYKVGEEFTYYFGGGWNAWKFPTDEDWNKAMENFSKTVKNPMEISVK